MANYTVGTGQVAVHTKQLTANTVDTVTFTGDTHITVEILTDGAAAIYVSTDGSAPTVAGQNCYAIPATPCTRELTSALSGTDTRQADLVRHTHLQRLEVALMSLKFFGGGGGGAPSAHKTTHEPGGSDALTLLDNTSIKSGAAIALAKLAGYGGHYRSVYIAGARATSAGAASTKYFFYTNQIDISTAGVGVGNQIYMFPFYAADYAVTGLTTKLRLRAVVQTATAPAITITCGLYPVVAGSTISLGTVFSGSTVAFASPAANDDPDGTSGDFDAPSDGKYAIGYTLSGAPAGTFSMQALLQVRNV